jgi:hypothetical protein
MMRIVNTSMVAGVIALGLLGFGARPQKAAAEPGYSVHPASKYRAFSVRGTHGGEVFVSMGSGGVVEVSVFQLRKSGMVEYAVRGSYTDDHIKARFPGLGRLDMHWRPSGKPEVTQEPQGDCNGRKALVQQGAFAGSFSFRGEQNYTRVKVKRVKGFMLQTFREVCKGPNAGPQPPVSEEILTAEGRRSDGRMVGFEAWSKEEWGTRIQGFDATLIERRRNLGIRRTTFAGGEPVAGQFMFDNQARTALVAPPSPFDGTAELTNSSSDPWTGDLSVSFLGFGRVPLAGPGFNAQLTQTGAELSPVGS